MTIARPSIRGAWLAVLALLLMTQSAVAGAWEAPHDDRLQSLRVAATVPAAVHLRDAGKLTQVAARVVAAKPRFDLGAGDPPLPSHAAIAAPPIAAAAVREAAAPGTAPHVWRACDLIGARAPPGTR